MRNRLNCCARISMWSRNWKVSNWGASKKVAGVKKPWWYFMKSVPFTKVT